jgi:hypothetical protein
MKDPAFIFYPADFLGGVSDLTMEERGQYITMLCLQHEKGAVSEKTIRLVFQNNLSPDVLAKFGRDEIGYFNVRLRSEIEKRAQFAERQSERGKLGGAPKGNRNAKKQPENNPKTSGKTNEKQPLLEDVNVNENKNINGDSVEGGMGGDPKPAAENKADVYAAAFETFRKNYPGTKRGRETEFAVLKKHKDWREVVFTLTVVLAEQIRWRDEAQHNGVTWLAEWPHLQTWLNQRRWETELNFDFEANKPNTNPIITYEQMTDEVRRGANQDDFEFITKGQWRLK